MRFEIKLPCFVTSPSVLYITGWSEKVTSFCLKYGVPPDKKIFLQGL